MTQVLHIPDDVLDAARLTIPELRQEIALHLYAQGRLPIGKARELAQMSLWEFRQLLAARKIEVQFDVDDLDHDVEVLRKLDER
jgi:predicted HTH domain antitoxin